MTLDRNALVLRRMESLIKNCYGSAAELDSLSPSKATSVKIDPGGVSVTAGNGG